MVVRIRRPHLDKILTKWPTASRSRAAAAYAREEAEEEIKERKKEKEKEKRGGEEAEEDHSIVPPHATLWTRDSSTNHVRQGNGEKEERGKRREGGKGEKRRGGERGKKRGRRRTSVRGHAYSTRPLMTTDESSVSALLIYLR